MAARGRVAVALGALAAALAACGGAASPAVPGTGGTPAASAPSSSGSAAASGGGVRVLAVEPQNSSLVPGIDRLSLALIGADKKGVTGARATLSVYASDHSSQTLPLQNIGPEYGGIPVYDGVARFAAPGTYLLVVDATLPDGSRGAGQVAVRVSATSSAAPIGWHVPALQQHILGDPGVTLAMLDSGVPPDSWHNATIATGLAEHKPMVLYFGEPGYCVSATCGPTVSVLQQLCKQLCGQMLFEHIEDHFPAAPNATGKDNPAFDAFGLETDPWVYFVNAQGVVSDRYEGPVTLTQLTASAQGTLAGAVPAVNLTAGS